MSNPEYQPVSPQGVPSPVTPADSPSDPSGYASVTPHGAGPAPYDIQAPMDEAAIQAAYDGAGAVSAAGVSAYSQQGPRQAQAATLMNSPQGFSSGGGTSGWDITAGFSGGGGDGWPNNPQPSILETPVQGQPNSYPANTGTD